MTTRLANALEGRYAIEREIGAGGMATVYLARDLKHRRSVALKVLNPELGAILGVERFLSEIQVTANLQHPHLLPLFDSGEADGLLFYVMPYIAGESLRARLDRERQLPVAEAVRIAIAVAGALDYAHRHHVIHRDLKPENILLHDGQPLIADFGIALAVSNAGGARVTQTGLSLGTPQYMSPEQATGDRAVDGRSDIYSLGAVTYEMLAGEAPHLGNTVQAIVAKVLTEKPVDVRVRRSSVPEHVAVAIDRALEKTPADRFNTGHDFAAALAGETMARRSTATVAPIAGKTSRFRVAREVVAWTLVAVALTWLAWQWARPTVATDAPVIRAQFDLPANSRIHDALTGATIALTPQADRIVFTAISVDGFRLYARNFSELTARTLADANVAARNITVSPDGRWVAFTEGGAVRKVSIDGGTVTTVSSFGTVPYGLAWLSNDTIVMGSFTGMYLIDASGSNPVMVPRSDTTADRIGQRWPAVIPGTDLVIYTSGASNVGDGQLAVSNVRTGAMKVFQIALAAPLGIQHDRLVYITGAGFLMALPFDVHALEPRGDAVQLDDQVLADAMAGAKAALSPSGTLAYLRGRTEIQPVLVKPGTNELQPLMGERQQYLTPRYSPDGKRVAITVGGSNSGQIWLYDVVNNTFTRLTNEGMNLRPEWTPDGKRVVFRSERGGRGGIWWQPADGSAPAELLYQPDVDPFEAIISPDNKWIVYRSGPGVTHSRDIFAVPLEGPRTPIVLAEGPTTQSQPRLSPNGKWLVYQSNEQARFEIFVRPFPGTGARVQVSTEGGTEPVWDRSGRTLYYRGPSGEVIAVAVTTDDAFSIGTRKTIVTGEYLLDTSHPSYDVAPDGRVLLLGRAGAETQTIIVHNWANELRQKTAPRR